MGNFVNGEAHGVQTNNIFRMGIVENGIYMEFIQHFYMNQFLH